MADASQMPARRSGDPAAEDTLLHRGRAGEGVGGARFEPWQRHLQGREQVRYLREKSFGYFCQPTDLY